MRARLLCLVIGVIVIAPGCANANALREQPALPNALRYALTATPPPAMRTPTDSSHSTLSHTNPPRVQTLASLAPILLSKPVRDATVLKEYRRGIAYVAIRRGEYQSETSRQALDKLFATGANYLSVLVTWYQNDIHATDILPTDDTPADGELEFVIAYAHAHGVRVLLKPQVDLLYDDQHWRGEIEFDTEQDWQKWFASYRRFIMYYARLAQTRGVEEFAIGAELRGTTTRTADWRALIRGVRAEYSGLLTYCANHSGEEMQVEFWNDLDYIGVNVFYNLTTYRTPTLEQILEGWLAPVETLTELHRKFPQQPIVFTEVGYPSMDLASVWPWNWKRAGAVDLQEQAMLYEALFQTWWHNPERPWFRGMFIWNWLPDPNQGGVNDTDYTPHGKPAEEILRHYYQNVTAHANKNDGGN